MRHTLYFTLPDVASAETTIRDLLLAQIEIPWIHCLARRGLPLGELPEANILQRADVMHGWGTGISFGGVLGAIVGGLMVLFPPFGTDLHIWTMPIVAVAGAVFGVWASSIAGHRRAPFQERRVRAGHGRREYSADGGCAVYANP